MMNKYQAICGNQFASTALDNLVSETSLYNKFDIETAEDFKNTILQVFAKGYIDRDLMLHLSSFLKELK